MSQPPRKILLPTGGLIQHGKQFSVRYAYRNARTVCEAWGICGNQPASGYAMCDILIDLSSHRYYKHRFACMLANENREYFQAIYGTATQASARMLCPYPCGMFINRKLLPCGMSTGACAFCWSRNYCGNIFARAAETLWPESRGKDRFFDMPYGEKIRILPSRFSIVEISTARTISCPTPADLYNRVAEITPKNRQFFEKKVAPYFVDSAIVGEALLVVVMNIRESLADVWFRRVIICRGVGPTMQDVTHHKQIVRVFNNPTPLAAARLIGEAFQFPYYRKTPEQIVKIGGWLAALKQGKKLRLLTTRGCFRGAAATPSSVGRDGDVVDTGDEQEEETQ